MTCINPIDYIAIRNTIAKYCIALDSKDWPSLRNVFTSDVHACYPFSEMNGVDEVAVSIEQRRVQHTSTQAKTKLNVSRLQHITSQHALTTQTIEIEERGEAAEATTYFTGIHFGKGKWQGQQVTAWGKYIDDLVLVGHKDQGLPGASGPWRIRKRVVVFMSRLGEEGVMKGDHA